MCKTYSKEWIFLKEKRKLTIKGAILDKYQLENYLEKIAADHILTEKSDKDTYPIPRLKENFFVIKEVYKILNEQIIFKIGKVDKEKIEEYKQSFYRHFCMGDIVWKRK